MNILNYGADPWSSGAAPEMSLTTGPGISERTLPGDRVAEPRWSSNKQQATSCKLDSYSMKDYIGHYEN